jgi:hypothetical protein
MEPETYEEMKAEAIARWVRIFPLYMKREPTQKEIDECEKEAIQDYIDWVRSDDAYEGSR